MDQKNLILAIVLSVIILVSFQFYMELFGPQPPEPTVTTAGEQGAVPGEVPPSIEPENGHSPLAQCGTLRQSLRDSRD